MCTACTTTFAHLKILCATIKSSDAHFCQSPVIGQLIVQTPIRTLVCLNEIQSGGLQSQYFYDAAYKPAIVFPTNSSLIHCKTQTSWQVHSDHRDTVFWLKQVALCSARSKNIIMLCRLYCWTKSSFMIRNHSTAAVQGLIVCNVNFNFSSFVHKSGVLLFCIFRAPCPVKIWSPGHFVK